MTSSQPTYACIMQANDRIQLVLLYHVFLYTTNSLKEKSYVLGENFTKSMTILLAIPADSVFHPEGSIGAQTDCSFNFFSRILCEGSVRCSSFTEVHER